jgi:teichoic acid transport system ATP-binding protein
MERWLSKNFLVAHGEGYKRMRKYQYGRVPKSIEKMLFYGTTLLLAHR